MKNSIRIAILFILVTAAALAAGGCAKDEIMTFDTTQNAIHFPMGNGYTEADATFYQSFTFLEDPMAESAVVEIPVDVLGPASPEERPVSYSIDPEKSTAPKGSYEILSATVPAGELTGFIRLKLPNLAELQDKTYQIVLLLEANEAFKLGPKNYLKAMFSWNDMLPKPTITSLIRSYNMLVAGEPSFISTSLNSYSSSAHKAIVAALGWDDWDDANVHGGLSNNASVGYYKYLPRYNVIYNGDLYKAYAAAFGDYLEEYNAAHPDAPLLHDGGNLAGKPVEARTY
ncbi:DUF4843 domain-containing protein [Alistipes sp.]|uniref:DUF4843 domain-containing protein n=1 Tax=Alistipes sp. TaxID=1872444 RepID=UPI003AF00A20